MIIQEDKYLKHYGILRKSGRYPWNSGGNIPQRSRMFLDYVESMKGKGLTEAEIAKGVGLSSTELRNLKSTARTEIRAAHIAQVHRLAAKGMSNVAIGEQMGMNESSVRALRSVAAKENNDIVKNISDMLKREVAEKKYIQIGVGVENQLGVSKDRLGVAVSRLKDEGYVVRTVQVDQLGTGPGNKTLVKVLAPPGTTYRQIRDNMEQIRLIEEKSTDFGESFLGILPPVSINSRRVQVAYEEDGGGKLDGVIYVRPGVDDISMGKARYAQVRIMIDNTHYLKGMAMYKDDLPPGVDLLFNTAKSRAELGSNKLKAMKNLKTDKEGIVDADNPFGSAVDQIKARDPKTGKEYATSAMNKVNEEGKWETWKKNLPSQVLSKQSPTLAKTQLDMTYERRLNQFKEINSLTNPVVKKKLLEAFADETDVAAVHLQAAHLPRQATHVILPFNSLKENEIYAPRYRPGERVALIRFPHGGTFEIPELIVNNKNREAKNSLGDTQDAVGINAKVAQRLSGADFDGDTVLVIPNPISNPKLKTTPALEGLKGFDPIRAYPKYDGMKPMDSQTKGFEMGKISNLITDMTIRKATPEELARAVKHSMVVIDAEKHELNYKQSALDNNIPALKKKYQGSAKAGASTLISRAKSPIKVPKTKVRGIDKETGRPILSEPETFVNRKGEVVTRSVFSKKLKETQDAHSLSSGTVIEKVYADHSNKLKALANTARKTSVNTVTKPRDPSARVAYKKEIESLDAKLNIALKNRVLERQAQIIGNHTLSTKRAANPEMTEAEIKKTRHMALEAARVRTGAQKKLVDITPPEWEAIQANAISPHKLTDILDNADLDTVKKLATPRTNLVMTSTKTRRAQAMLASGYTQAEVADALGVALSTLKSSIAK